MDTNAKPATESSVSDTKLSINEPKPAPAFPVLPDPVTLINEYDRALASLVAEEKHLREELAVADPLESTNDTLEAATQLLLVIRGIAKIKQERGAALRRLAGGLGI